MVTFNEVSAAVIFQEYIKAANNAKREVLIAAYQGSENYYKLINITVEARKAVDKA